MYVEYDSNNSGGHWWLRDEHWKSLEKAGWKVQWADLVQVYESNETVLDADGTPLLRKNEDRIFKPTLGEDGQWRWLGALATKAYRAGLPLREAAEEWERVTGLDSTDAGCACCGQPHTFTEYSDAGQFVSSGPSASYEAHW